MLSLPKKNPIVLCHQTLYRYFFNRYDQEGTPWPGTIAILYENLKKYSPDFYQKKGQKQIPRAIADAGWHFTIWGGWIM